MVLANIKASTYNEIIIMYYGRYADKWPHLATVGGGIDTNESGMV